MADKDYLLKLYKNLVDIETILLYTNALYAAPEDSRPHYNEFRDMFSTGQLKSKLWLIAELSKSGLYNSIDDAVIAGAWYGLLGVLLAKVLRDDASITLLDIDPRCEEFMKHAFWQHDNLIPTTFDMYAYKYTQDLVVNTSCEHIPDLTKWLATCIPNETLVILQSNNHAGIDGHVNCVQSVDEFKAQAQLSEIFYEGELDCDVYTRYMLIGLK